MNYLFGASKENKKNEVQIYSCPKCNQMGCFPKNLIGEYKVMNFYCPTCGMKLRLRFNNKISKDI